MAINPAMMGKIFGGLKRGWGTVATNPLKAATGEMTAGEARKAFATSVGASYLYHGVMERERNTPARALGISLVESAAYMVAPKLYLAARIGFPIARAAATAIPLAYQAKEARWNQFHKPNLGGDYTDTQQALTMRQAGVQAIQGSRMNARNALGNEAQLMHR